MPTDVANLILPVISHRLVCGCVRNPPNCLKQQGLRQTRARTHPQSDQYLTKENEPRPNCQKQVNSVSGSSVRKDVEVQVLLSAPNSIQGFRIAYICLLGHVEAVSRRNCRKCSQALNILDRFQIVAKFNQALDEVRSGGSQADEGQRLRAWSRRSPPGAFLNGPKISRPNRNSN